MIYRNAVVTISNGTATIDSPIILYRGDYEVEVLIEVKSSPYRQTQSSDNLLVNLDASYSQMVIRIPNLDPIISDIIEVKDGTVTFTFTSEMIDDTTEVGDYDFQIRAFDESMSSRVTLPPVLGGIKIKEPIAFES